MAKKIVRGITDVKTINNQDFDTNNVNDLLSDGQYNYIHRKKGKTEEYHNLTDNIKTISSDNTELLSVTNNNKTTNTATLHPKHDKQKEQVLESTRNTVNIQHGTNGTGEKTTVDTNPLKVLEHTNLLTGYGISKNTTGNTTKLGLEYTRVAEGLDLNNLSDGKVRSNAFVNAPYGGWLFVSTCCEGAYGIQRAISLNHEKNAVWVRCKIQGTWQAWREQVGDKSVIDDLLSQKQDTLTAGTGITIDGQTISATGGGGGETSSIKFLTQQDEGAVFEVYKHTISSGGETLTTFTFSGVSTEAETVLTGELKEELKQYVFPNISISNGALTIKNDGTNIKLINSAPSAPSQNVMQQATFTFTRKVGPIPSPN